MSTGQESGANNVKHKRSAAAVSLLAVGAMVLSGCSNSHATLAYAAGAKVDCGGKQAITASGSTAQANAMTRFVAAYSKACSGQTLNYTANGSGAGISEFLAGKTDFGGSDTPLSGDQYATARQRCGGADAWNLPVVFGPLAITYNLGSVDSLVLDGPTLAKIFNGTITRWDDPAVAALNASMPSEDIRVIYRSDASGTTDNFQSYLQAASGGAWNKGVGKTFNGGAGTGAAGNIGTSAAVKTTEGAISYNELSFALQQGFSPPRSKPRQAVGRYARSGSGRIRWARPSQPPKSSATATISCSTFRRSTTPPNPTSTR
jgi:phosphate transport system substrate-binding protein